MSNPTSNFGWQMPTPTDLVTDLPADFEVFGQAVDSTMADLKGGTSGQILSKNSNTDMDFVWTTPNPGDITGVTAGTGISGGGTFGDVTITNSMATAIDAKGDLIAGTGADAFSRLAVGNNGETLVADSAASTGLRYTAGTVQSNPVLNSAFQVWQRGTSFSAAAYAAQTYLADRWWALAGGSSSHTVARQATGDTTNLPNIQYCTRIQRVAGNTQTTNINLAQDFETINSIPYAGKTITFSFYARAGANYSGGSLSYQVRSGTGTDQSMASGYTNSSSFISSSAALTTTWQRFTATAAVSSLATQLGELFFNTPSGTAGANDYWEVTGVQIDIGSVALPFRTNGGTIQGELAACQRYYWRAGGDQAYQVLASGGITEGSYIIVPLQNPVTMRTTPTSVDYSTLMAYDGVSIIAATAVNLNLPSRWVSRVNVSLASSPTNYRPYQLFTNNSTSGYIGFSAEL